ncbi:MAG: hypothetical protein Q4D31_04540 [Eubacteriales bacterium]|nr:hypothetical protein [Eubacteriales bacterium]
MIWSCTKFLAELLLIPCGMLIWIGVGAYEPFWVVLGWACVIGGIVGAGVTYARKIAPVIQQENSENKD